MRPIKTIGFLGFSPIIHSSACRYIPFPSQQDLYLNCPTAGSHNDLRAGSRSHSSVSYSRFLSTAGSSARYSFRVGAAFSAKNTRFNPKTDRFSFELTKVEKEINTGRPRSGQDAFFISKIGNGSNIAFGVADGVGGWIESGIDSAHFSHGICRSMAKIAQDTTGSGDDLGVQQLLQKGYEEVVADRSILGGGSTACVAVAKDDGNLEVAK